MQAIIKQHPAPGLSYQREASDRSTPPGHVTVAVAAASVCGTDIAIKHFSPAAQAFRLRLPVIVGHEGAGVVTAVGAGVTSLGVGERVAFESHIACLDCYQCRHGNAHLCERMRLLGLHVDGVFADACTVPAHALYRIPDGFDLESAALLEPAGVAMHAIQEARESLLGQRVLVIGAGPVGALIAELSHLAGAAHVAVVEPNAWRRTFVAAAAQTALEPGPEVGKHLRSISTDRGGFDVAFEASGHPSGFTTAVDALRTGGTYVAVGFGSETIALQAGEYLNRRAIVLRGSFGRLLWSTWDLLVALITEGRLNLSRYITHRFALDHVEEAFESLRGDAMKILLLPSLADD